ncbi:MAG: type II 3-dehydroquinate dehydratase [Exiguobacterium sp.]|uniref:3-dehydroquinate dehydratase n=2 Tax=Exiguobacterium TaxID=33986 RepID=AROQ_EXISA|nr:MULTISPECIES: type II 3-dehydroquinate dehydratase [Exiguobacterium]C4L3G2.1 RecName: Full=3-dehydroquinate dehydratase; Short=3-dehydroquinase; AltName: Full=Type II DHQase [Exiguobacterium sp. AT1b]MCC9625091.1 type II 3-dehydroquinate dehydratase [Thalassospira sp. MA62]HUP80289.1 type II 3-dehydroquinate dehydratase [Pirellula sp.]ACQ69460.1 3-dehydroquinate dehydratase, type II [Exiguobacterium sp. AT1b]MBQ6458414.1 type II 3-dehydroquinate dehydratase [Exiguobacterium sp.]MBR2076810.
MRILVLNGPNLNLLGRREPDVYGDVSLKGLAAELMLRAPEDVELTFKQSNHEGDLIDALHDAFDYEGVILNAGAYTHTSIAIRDAISAIAAPVVEVHISNVHARETFRHESKLAAVCIGVITGFGLTSYTLAMHALIEHWRNRHD